MWGTLLIRAESATAKRLNEGTPPSEIHLVIAKRQVRDYETWERCQHVMSVLSEAFYKERLTAVVYCNMDGQRIAVSGRCWYARNCEFDICASKVSWAEIDIPEDHVVVVGSDELDGYFNGSGGESAVSTEPPSSVDTAETQSPGPKTSAPDGEGAREMDKAKRKGGRKPGPYRAHLKRCLKWYDEKHPGDLDEATLKDLDTFARTWLAKHYVKKIPKRSTLESAIKKVRSEIMDTKSRR